MTGVGLSLPQLGPGIDAQVVRSFCREAEAAGFTSLWVQEHIFFPRELRSDYAGIKGAKPPDIYRTTLAATELLATAAAHTTSCLIGTGILVGGYHRPVELAQRLTTLDILSEGRLVAGLGVGWSDEEHIQMDVNPRTRGRRLTELVQAVRACWGPDPVRHQGEFFDIPAAYVSPKPIRGAVPLIAGTSSRAGLDRTVAHFDGWNPAGLPVAKVVRIAEELNRRRGPEQGPLTIWPRVFVQSPLGPADLQRVFDEVQEGKAAGLAEIVIDATFWDAVVEPLDWLKVIEWLMPALDQP